MRFHAQRITPACALYFLTFLAYVFGTRLDSLRGLGRRSLRKLWAGFTTMTTSKTRKSEFFPDAWKRFEAAVDAAAKHGPMHKTTKPQKAPSRPKTTSRKSGKPA